MQLIKSILSSETKLKSKIKTFLELRVENTEIFFAHSIISQFQHAVFTLYMIILKKCILFRNFSIMKFKSRVKAYLGMRE